MPTFPKASDMHKKYNKNKYINEIQASNVPETFEAMTIVLMEARAGIEPAFKDLQSSTSPFCHRALYG